MTLEVFAAKELTCRILGLLRSLKLGLGAEVRKEQSSGQGEKQAKELEAGVGSCPHRQSLAKTLTNDTHAGVRTESKTTLVCL